MISTFTFLLVFTAQWVAFIIMSFVTFVLASDINDVVRNRDTDFSARVFKSNLFLLLAAMSTWGFLLLVGRSV